VLRLVALPVSRLVERPPAVLVAGSRDDAADAAAVQQAGGIEINRHGRTWTGEQTESTVRQGLLGAAGPQLDVIAHQRKVHTDAPA
jgi:hypothetical protein